MLDGVVGLVSPFGLRLRPVACSRAILRMPSPRSTIRRHAGFSIARAGSIEPSDGLARVVDIAVERGLLDRLVPVLCARRYRSPPLQSHPRVVSSWWRTSRPPRNQTGRHTTSVPKVAGSRGVSLCTKCRARRRSGRRAQDAMSRCQPSSSAIGTRCPLANRSTRGCSSVMAPPAKNTVSSARTRAPASGAGLFQVTKLLLACEPRVLREASHFVVLSTPQVAVPLSLPGFGLTLRAVRCATATFSCLSGHGGGACMEKST